MIKYFISLIKADVYVNYPISNPYIFIGEMSYIEVGNNFILTIDQTNKCIFLNKHEYSDDILISVERYWTLVFRYTG